MEKRKEWTRMGGWVHYHEYVSVNGYVLNKAQVPEIRGGGRMVGRSRLVRCGKPSVRWGHPSLVTMQGRPVVEPVIGRVRSMWWGERARFLGKSKK